ncbi:MAG TPA: cytochrome c biogenesis protein CcdA [Anaerolineae bacterium]|nr:cytochrome c biogenesis protein CcdA [Anaerolineae bacterium]HID85623.1 cytochrome c biogenesis protein CcdA [Anaerolineales bacterium]HIQ08598.1 cytochrome c biogenesis protein CcdA [Anaerolineaceae bacterium]
MQVTAGLAFLAGLLSFLSPCVLPLVPAYIGYLGGMAIGAQDEETPVSRGRVFIHGLAFVLGFSAVFVLLGVGASALGGALYDLRFWLARIGGLIVIIFGIHTIGIYRIPFLEQDLRPEMEVEGKGLLSSALMGVLFSAGWSPCVGPVLGAILTLSLQGGSVAQGALLLSVYSAGLAVPFLLTALALEPVAKLIRRYSRVSRIAEIVMGVLLVIVGVMLLTGTFARLAQLGNFFDFGL